MSFLDSDKALEGRITTTDIKKYDIYYFLKSTGTIKVKPCYISLMYFQPIPIMVGLSWIERSIV